MEKSINETINSSFVESNRTYTNSSEKTKKNVLKLSNDLLNICNHIIQISTLKSTFKFQPPRHVDNITQVDSSLFIYFYEKICQTELIDKKWPAKTFEDEIHNVQAVIDSLSLDILHEDLSHLTGESICGQNLLEFEKTKRDLVSVEYLLDILMCLSEWVDCKQQTHGHVSLENTLEEKNDQVDLKEKRLDNKIDVKSTETHDLFKDYMNKMENEYRMNKSNSTLVSIIHDQNKQSYSDNTKNRSFESLTGSESGSSSSSNDLIELLNSHDLSVHQNNSNAQIQTLKNEINIIRSNLDTNLTKQTRNIADLLKRVYDDDLIDAECILKQKFNKAISKSDFTDQVYQNSIKDAFKNNEKLKNRCCKKSVLLPRSKSIGSLSTRTYYPNSKLNKNQMRRSASSLKISSSSASPLYLSQVIIGDNGILNMLLNEFPYLYTSPETIHYLWQKHSKQLNILAKQQKEIENEYSHLSNLDLNDTHYQSTLKIKQTKAQLHLKESYQKQKLLMDIMRKDLSHLERIEDLKKLKKADNALKAKQREQRFQNVKAKRHYEDLCLRQKARMLKQQTSEELIFKKLFNDTLKLQKERMLELKKYAKEKKDESQKKQINQIESIENYYKTKFDLLNEKMSSDKAKADNRQAAQSLVVNKMKLEFKNKLENQIKDLQEQMCRDKDFLHWREMDAQQMIKKILNANYYSSSK